MVAVKKWIKDGRFALAMLIVQLISGVLQILARVIFSQGAFVYAYLFYRHVVGAICTAPPALYRERDGGKKLSWRIFFWLFVDGLTGMTIALGLFCYGLADTTATYATNFLTLIPVVTFLLSVILRVEKLQLHTIVGKMKTLSAILCLVGALVIALYKGKAFHIIHSSREQHIVMEKVKPHNWTRGTIFLIGSCLSNALWFISQGKLFELYPYKFWATFYTCTIASVQQAIIGLCIDRSKEAWQLGWNLQLFTIFFSGVLATALSFCVISWAVAERGPTYPAMFTPLRLLSVTIGEVVFLNEALSVGGLLGMCFMIVGIYSFLLAKNKEMKIKTTNAGSESQSVEPTLESI
ncbi:WAT1-related protein At5g64700-like [Coffea arabica]|uniref:WAT1-related protein n=1 Tax=Coffea arabica TaxID=13443 RepID=A0ABM4X7Q7_COFAR